MSFGTCFKCKKEYRKIVARGICNSCYVGVVRRVETGQSSWALEEKAGNCQSRVRSAPERTPAEVSQEPVVADPVVVQPETVTP